MELLTVPISSTLRLGKTISGLYRGFTADDIARNMDITVRALASNDINRASTVIICGKYSSQYLLDLHYAAEALGATVIPCNDVQAVIDVANIFNANTLITTAKNLQEILDRAPDILPPKIIALVHTFQKIRCWKKLKRNCNAHCRKFICPDISVLLVYSSPARKISCIFRTIISIRKLSTARSSSRR